jgi:hypothetical protein
MAFFGLTALGPQNSFAAGSRHITHLMVFDDEDFTRVWNSLADGEHAMLNKIPDMMRLMYRGPVPENVRSLDRFSFVLLYFFSGNWCIMLVQDQRKIEEAFSIYHSRDTISYRVRVEKY